MNFPALNVAGVNGVSGALPLFVDHAPVANFNADGVQFHGSIVVDGRPVAMRSEMNHAAFVGGCYGALVMLVSVVVAYAAASARKAWQLRAWIARQPKPDGHPFRGGYPQMYEGSYRRPPLDRLVPPSSPPALVKAPCICEHCCDVMKAKLSAAGKPPPTSLPGPGRTVLG